MRLCSALSVSSYDKSTSTLRREAFDERRGGWGGVKCVHAHVCDRTAGEVKRGEYSHLSDHSPSPPGAFRGPHCSPKASARRHCCCAATALHPPPTPPHRKQGYSPRDVTSETPTPARSLALAPSRPQPIAMTTEKRIEYK